MENGFYFLKILHYLVVFSSSINFYKYFRWGFKTMAKFFKNF